MAKLGLFTTFNSPLIFMAMSYHLILPNLRAIYSFLWIAILFGLALSSCTSWLGWGEPQNELERRRLVAKSLVLLRNDAQAIPITSLSETLSLLQIANRPLTSLEQSFSLYTSLTTSLYQNATQDSAKAVQFLNELPSSHTWIVAIDAQAEPATSWFSNLQKWASGQSVIWVFFGQNAINYAPDSFWQDTQTVIYVPNSDTLQQNLVAQMIMGGREFVGELDDKIGIFDEHTGWRTAKTRLGYGIPEEVGMRSDSLQKIDAIVQKALDSAAMPGAQLLIARHGTVVYHKAFGHHTYNKKQKVKLDDVYDLASISKVSTALPLLMQLQSEGKFSPDSTWGSYLPSVRQSDKSELRLRDILSHQAGLIPYIAYFPYHYQKAGKRLSPEWFATQASPDFNVAVSPSLFVHKDFYEKEILRRILKSKLSKDKKYVYSGLAFLLFPEMIKEMTKRDMESYLQKEFYEPLGMQRSGFNPYKNKQLAMHKIVPTEYDATFRKAQIHGYVHDEAAALLGGVSSNAGLFSSANDLAKLFQMYLQKGSYGGKTYIRADVIDEYTKCQFCADSNRRALGFDKPLLVYSPDGVSSIYASKESFGHYGFTGTRVWADPAQGLLYIFLSNRVYPTRENPKLGQMRTRVLIEDVIYRSLLTP
ncbi:MAG: serine hydrolase [Bernardetiaceae bacterium]|nr:serine hydrolase [Bernardetiaceae bacterium]